MDEHRFGPWITEVVPLAIQPAEITGLRRAGREVHKLFARALPGRLARARPGDQQHVTWPFGDRESRPLERGARGQDQSAPAPDHRLGVYRLYPPHDPSERVGLEPRLPVLPSGQVLLLVEALPGQVPGAGQLGPAPGKLTISIPSDALSA